MSTIQKYIWVIETLQNNRLTLDTLCDRYGNNDAVNPYHETLNRQSFWRWRKDIADMFSVDIVCDKNNNRYYIENPEELEKRGLTKWLLKTYSTLNSLENSLKVKERILTESIPSSEKYLNTVIGAMKENRVVRFTYTKFGTTEGYTCTVRPYCVKLFQQRWYLLGYCEERKDLRTYGLDRVTDCVVTSDSFNLPGDFDAEDYFATHFGVDTRTDIECQRITFRAWEPHNHYLRALPLHGSQKEIDSGDDYTDFEVYLRPNYEFYWKLLSMGNYIQILLPDVVRGEMVNWLKKIEENYK